MRIFEPTQKSCPQFPKHDNKLSSSIRKKACTLNYYENTYMPGASEMRLQKNTFEELGWSDSLTGVGSWLLSCVWRMRRHLNSLVGGTFSQWQECTLFLIPIAPTGRTEGDEKPSPIVAEPAAPGDHLWRWGCKKKPTDAFGIVKVRKDERGRMRNYEEIRSARGSFNFLFGIRLCITF